MRKYFKCHQNIKLNKIKGHAGFSFYDVCTFRATEKFLLSIGEAGKIADKVSDLIVFHNRVAENAKKQYV